MICGSCVFNGFGFGFGLGAFVAFGVASYALGAGLGGFTFECGLLVGDNENLLSLRHTAV